MVLNNNEGIESQSKDTCVTVDSGICGFACRIKAWKIEKRVAGLAVSESDCQQIRQFSELLQQLALKDVFAPISRNPVYLAAEKTGCHPSCPIPPAVLKVAEVALEMALPRDAAIRFKACQEGED